MAFGGRRSPPSVIPFFFLCCLAHVSRTLSLSPDGEALLSLVAVPSQVLPSWDPTTSQTPCNWEGVSCSPQSRVISLNLPNLSSIPCQLSSLSSLQLLNLSSTNVSGTIPPCLGQLSSLRLLDLSSNSLSGPIPHEFSNLSSLQFLFFNSNKLSGRIPPQLSNLTNLQVLCLQDNLQVL